MNDQLFLFIRSRVVQETEKQVRQLLDVLSIRIYNWTNSVSSEPMPSLSSDCASNCRDCWLEKYSKY